MELLNWLYWNIPFMQLLGTRINIVGFIWQVVLTVWMGFYLSKISPFNYSKKKNLIFLANMAVGSLLVLAIHQYVDFTFICLEILSGHDYMISANEPAWDWSVFWITSFWCLIFLSLIVRWVFRIYDLRKYLRLDWFPILSFSLVICWWVYHLAYFPYDYAVLSGEQRVTVFWSIYPELYLLYGLSYISLWRRKK